MTKAKPKFRKGDIVRFTQGGGTWRTGRIKSGAGQGQYIVEPMHDRARPVAVSQGAIRPVGPLHRKQWDSWIAECAKAKKLANRKPKFENGDIVSNTENGGKLGEVVGIRIGDVRIEYDVIDFGGQSERLVEQALKKATKKQIERFNFWRTDFANKKPNPIPAKKKKIKPRKTEKQFIVLYQNDDTGEDYEIETFRHLDCPGIFHSVAAAEKAILEQAERDKEYYALDNTGASMEYFIAEIIKPVEVKFETQINVRMK